MPWKELLPRCRYYLELISTPVFALLVVHLSGEGIMFFLETGTADHSHDEHSAQLFSPEILSGIIALAVFTWLWHLPWLKRLVPCRHENCQHRTNWTHWVAASAFVLHFFPESEVRYLFWQEFSSRSVYDWVVISGFFSHFLVDVILIFFLGNFLKSWKGRITFWIAMVGGWSLALLVGSNGGLHWESLPTGVVLLFSGFFLAMFVHRPHQNDHKHNHQH